MCEALCTVPLYITKAFYERVPAFLVLKLAVSPNARHDRECSSSACHFVLKAPLHTHTLLLSQNDPEHP